MEDTYNKLLKAGEKNDVATFEKLLKEVPDVTKKSGERNILHCMAWYGKARLCKILAPIFKKKGQINEKDDCSGWGWTSLHYALAFNEAGREGADHVETCKILLEHGADTLAKDNNNNTPLHVCFSKMGYTEIDLAKEITPYLFQKEKDGWNKQQLLRAKDHRGDTILHLAVKQSERDGLEAVECLIDCMEKHLNVPDIEKVFVEKNNDGDSPLHVAAKEFKNDFSSEFFKKFKLIEGKSYSPHNPVERPEDEEKDPFCNLSFVSSLVRRFGEFDEKIEKLIAFRSIS